jgi:hypothetical protein
MLPTDIIQYPSRGELCAIPLMMESIIQYFPHMKQRTSKCPLTERLIALGYIMRLQVVHAKELDQYILHIIQLHWHRLVALLNNPSCSLLYFS